MRTDGSRALLASLGREGVDTVFGYPGGQIIPLYDALPEFPIRHILVRHEQGAAHAADGYARASGRVGVCLATSGPGATNLVTGLANAMVDSVPIVAVTGQVPRASLGCDAFQEADLTGITLPVVKHSYLVKEAADIPRIVREAFYIALTGRPGPVLIDLPRDVQEAGCEFSYPESVDLPGYRPNYDAHLPQINRAARVIASSKSPVILAGGGVIISGASDVLLTLAHKAGIPVVSTLLGLGAFPAGDPLFLGMAGMHGSVVANRALAETDVLIAVGTRFSDRVTGPAGLFAPHARIVHIDIDPAEVGKNIRVDLPVVADARRALEALLGSLESCGDHGEWLREIAAWRAESAGRPRKRAPRGKRTPGGSGGPRLSPTDVMDRLAGWLDGRGIVVTDVGQHQMWAAQRLPRERPRTFLSSGGLGTMGYGLPAALGAKVACPNVPVILVTGDGSFQMSLQQLATIREENLEVKIVLLNNGYLGMVRQWQDLFYRKRYSAVALGPYPDFCLLARAYGLRAARASTLPALDKAWPKIMSDDGPALLECRIEPEANVFPIIPPGRGVAETILHAD